MARRQHGIYDFYCRPPECLALYPTELFQLRQGCFPRHPSEDIMGNRFSDVTTRTYSFKRSKIYKTLSTKGEVYFREDDVPYGRVIIVVVEGIYFKAEYLKDKTWLLKVEEDCFISELCSLLKNLNPEVVGSLKYIRVIEY